MQINKQKILLLDSIFLLHLEKNEKLKLQLINRKFIARYPKKKKKLFSRKKEKKLNCNKETEILQFGFSFFCLTSKRNKMHKCTYFFWKKFSNFFVWVFVHRSEWSCSDIWTESQWKFVMDYMEFVYLANKDYFGWAHPTIYTHCKWSSLGNWGKSPTSNMAFTWHYWASKFAGS